MTTDKSVIALTFNITWGENVPVSVLDRLKQAGAKATFFVSTPWAKAHPDIVQRILKEGHELASLGSRPVDLTRYPREVVFEEIKESVRALDELTGKKPMFFRPPNGGLDDIVMEAATDSGMVTVLWNVDSHDWSLPGPDYIVRRVVSRVKPGSIILFNASDSNRDTPDAITPIIRSFKEKGIETVTLPELINVSGTTPATGDASRMAPSEPQPW